MASYSKVPQSRRHARKPEVGHARCDGNKRHTQVVHLSNRLSCFCAFKIASIEPLKGLAAVLQRVLRGSAAALMKSGIVRFGTLEEFRVAEWRSADDDVL